MSAPVTTVAGATGNLGGRIVRALVERGARACCGSPAIR